MVSSYRTVMLAISILSVSTAYAQSGGSNYQAPKGGTISPWIKLFDRNSSGVDNYHALVRPEIQLRSAMKQQDMGLKDLTSQVDNNKDKLEKFSATGSGSVFMQYSHYYDYKRDKQSASRRTPGKPSGS